MALHQSSCINLTASTCNNDCCVWAVQKRDFPQNLEGLLGVRTDERQGVERKAAVLRLVMQQVLAALRSCHDTGASFMLTPISYCGSSKPPCSTSRAGDRRCDTPCLAVSQEPCFGTARDGSRPCVNDGSSLSVLQLLLQALCTGM